MRTTRQNIFPLDNVFPYFSFQKDPVTVIPKFGYDQMNISDVIVDTGVGVHGSGQIDSILRFKYQ